MDDHVSDFFCQASDDAPHGNFHKVVALHNSPETTWEDLSETVPDLCKGWHELAYLDTDDRIEFTREYWLAKLPFDPKIHESISQFFNGVNDIGVYIVQRAYDDPFESHMVYSLEGGKGFFQGLAGATEKDIAGLQKVFPDHIIPKDYLSFLKIHNGFSKTTDTGVLASGKVKGTYNQFQVLLKQGEPLRGGSGKVIDPETLIPFYESFGMPVYQCFWSDWYPVQEMGNVYYSGFTNTISQVEESKSSTETLAFPDFLSWLVFYLETV